MPIIDLGSHPFAKTSSSRNSSAGSPPHSVGLLSTVHPSANSGFKREIDYFRKMNSEEEGLAIALEAVQDNSHLKPEQKVAEIRKMLALSAQSRIAHEGIDAFERQDPPTIQEANKLSRGEIQTLVAISNVRKIASGQLTPWFDDKIGESVEHLHPRITKNQIANLLQTQEAQGQRIWSQKEREWRQTSLEKIANIH